MAQLGLVSQKPMSAKRKQYEQHCAGLTTLVINIGKEDTRRSETHLRQSASKRVLLVGTRLLAKALWPAVWRAAPTSRTPRRTDRSSTSKIPCQREPSTNGATATSSAVTGDVCFRATAKLSSATDIGAKPGL